MDNLRGIDNEYMHPEEADEAYVTYPEADDGGVDCPLNIGTNERRMQVRAYNHWTRLLKDGPYPDIEDLDPMHAGDFSPYGVLLDFTAGMENPAIQYLGEDLRAECDASENIERLEDVPPRSLLSRLTDHYMQILANKAPIGFEAEFVNQRDAVILYRGILLPFSSDGEMIDFMYGVINWKEAASPLQQDELRLELSQMLDGNDSDTWDKPEVDMAESLEANADMLSCLISAGKGDMQADMENHMPDENAPLADWLHNARMLADSAKTADGRSRKALYDAIGRAYDFTVMTDEHAADYQMLLDDAGLKVQPRAPYTPVAKLVFGADYDKTRLTEVATAIGFGRSKGVARGEFADWLNAYEGGLKALVAEARAERRSAKPVQKAAPGKALCEKLRAAPALTLSDFSGDGSEFLVLVARRNKSGEVEILGALDDKQAITQQAMRKLD